MAKFESLHSSGWDTLRLGRLIREMRGQRVLVVGDVGVDRYTIGTVERISPEAPVPIVLVQEEKLKLGLAANVADNVQALQGEAFLVGVVGRDRAGADLKELLKNSKIKPQHLISDPTRRTVLKERLVSERQQLLRVDYESPHALSAQAEKQVLAKVRSTLSQVDAVIIEDYAKGMLSEKLMHAIIGAAKAKGKMVAIDPNAKTPARHYRGATVLTPNTKEAEKLSGISISDETSLEKAGRTILKLSSAKNVVITRGKEGMAIFKSGVPTVYLIPTYAREVYDVSGAGDTVIAVLTMAVAAGATLEEAAILGNLAAGVEVGKRGTATVSPDEIRVALEFFGTMVASV